MTNQMDEKQNMINMISRIILTMIKEKQEFGKIMGQGKVLVNAY